MQEWHDDQVCHDVEEGHEVGICWDYVLAWEEVEPPHYEEEE